MNSEHQCIAVPFFQLKNLHQPAFYFARRADSGVFHHQSEVSRFRANAGASPGGTSSGYSAPKVSAIPRSS